MDEDYILDSKSDFILDSNSENLRGIVIDAPIIVGGKIMAKYIQRGEALDYKNTTDAVITAGTPMKFGARVAVAGCDILPNEIGSIHVMGVFEFDTEATIAAGAEVYFDGTKILAATASGAVKAGFAVNAAASGKVAVSINA